MSAFAFLPRAFPRLSVRRTPTHRLTCARANASPPRKQSPAGKKQSASKQPSSDHGTLYVVPTPIGNARDITLRAVDILSAVDVIAAEDTRNARVLLRPLERPSHQLVLSCHEHNWRSRIPTLLSHLECGRDVALVSDAGTPCVSDPGAQVVEAVVAAGLKVVPLPGPCAAVSAIVASALPSPTFTFVGFLPRVGEARRKAIEHIGKIKSTVVLYEAPHRLLSTLRALQEIEGEGRPCCLAREMTKKYEQFLRFDTVSNAFKFYDSHAEKPRGEFTIVLAPSPIQPLVEHDLTTYPTAPVELTALVESLLKEGIPVSAAARAVSSACDVPKKLVYAYATNVKEKLLWAEPDT
ncbi:unnamed protein product [Agarophyton chilense]